MIVANIVSMEAVSLDDGSSSWSPPRDDDSYYDVTSLSEDVFELDTGPVVVGSTAVFSIGAWVRAIDVPTGREVFRWKLPAPCLAAPTVAPGRIFCRTSDDRVRAYRFA